jgi:hypothetical protein
MGLGALWDPNEHPRGWHGRFIKKFKLAPWLDKVLKDFSPRQFQSNNQAAQYAFNQGHRSPGGAFTPEALKRVHLDWDEAQDALRAGKIDPTTQRFVDAMTPHMQPAPEGLILSKTFAPDALGLRPENLNTNPEDQNSILHMIGNTITDKGFSATHLGTNDSHGPGKITMTIAASPGTKVAFSGASRSDRGVFMDRDQKLLVTHVDPDGQGGWYMMAVAEPPGATSGSPQTLVPGRKGAGLSEVQREARVGGPSATTRNIAEPPRAAPQEAPIQGHESVLPGQAPAPTAAKKAAKATRQAGYQKAAANEAAQAGQAPPAAPQPVTPTPAPAPPGNVGVRTEPVHEPIGGTPTEGRSASEIAGTPSQPSTPTPAPAPVPANNGTTFKQEFRDRGLQSPSAGPQRREFNNAYLGVTGGKKEPGDALRELDADIEHNKGLLKEMGSNDPKAAELKTNIQRQSELADLMAEHFNEPRTHKTPEAAPAAVTEATKAAKAAPAPKAAVAKKAAKAAPSPEKAPAPAKAAKKAGKFAAPEVGPGQVTRGSPHGVEVGDQIQGKKVASIERSAGRRFDFMDSDGKLITSIAPQGKVEWRRAGEASVPEKKAGGFATVKNLSPEERKSYDALSKEGKASYLARRRAGQSHEKALGTEAAKAAPAKATAVKAAKAAAPAAPKAVSEVQARADSAGLPKTVTGLRASAKEKGIRGFSTMNKEQLQRALLGEEVPKVEKALVSPEKLGPHIQAANTENDAKALMADHTLADLRNLAKANGVDLKGKRTKPQVQDAILKHLRGEETTGIKPEKVTESLDSELKKASVVTPDGPEGDGIRKALSEVDQNDPESLRKERDALEKEAARLRAAGDRPAAHLAQGAADVLGMRAQRISGVEEAAPAKKIEKVAPPAGHEDLGGTKADLLKIAAGEGVPHKQAMTKPQLIKAITDHRAGKTPTPGPAKMAAKKAAPAGELHLGEARGQAGKLSPTERIKPSGETKPAVTEPARAPKIAAKPVAREGLVPSGKTRGEAGAPTPVKKAAAKAAVADAVAEGGVPAHDDLGGVKFDKKLAKTYKPVTQPKQARFVKGPGEIDAEWGEKQRFSGDHYLILNDKGEPIYGSAAKEWEDMHSRIPGTENGWQKTATVNAYQYHGPPTTHVTTMADGTTETKNTVNDGDWITEQKNGEVQIIRDDKFKKLYDHENPVQATRGRSTEQVLQRSKLGGAQLAPDDAEIKRILREQTETPISREEADGLLRGLTKARLMDQADGLNIPRARTLTKDQLRQEIVNATVGRKIDSIATRGFTEVRPGSINEPPSAEQIATQARLQPVKATKEAVAKAEKAHPDVPTPVVKATRAKVAKAVPDGSVGTRGAEPIASKPRATEFDQAWEKAGIPKAPDKTSQGSIDEIRSDVSSGKITPEEGIRRMESEISLNQDEIDDINRTIRSGQVSGAELDKLRTQRDRLVTSKSAQESASKFMHGHFGKERVTVPEVLDQVKETQGQAWWDGLNKEDPEVFRQELENGTGLKLKGNNAQEIFQDALKQTIQKGLSERAARKAAPRKAARAVPEPNPDFAPGGAKHLDAKAIAGDLNIDQSVIDDAQSQLNAGKTPGQVAKDLEGTADARAVTNVFQNGGWHTESHPGMPHTPEEQAKRKAEFQAEYDKQAAKIGQIRELANRLKASRRPVARKAAAPKVAEDLAQARQETKNPAVRKQLAQAEQAVKDAGNEAEGLKQRILARHQTAWNEATTEEKAKAATDAMRQDLTLAEIRDWAKPQGITGRSKQDILDKAIARRFGQGGPPEVSGPAVNDRMARASQARAVARALADVEEVKANRGSKLAVSTRAKGMARAGGLPEPLVNRIHAAATSDNQTELNKIAEEHGLTKMAHSAGEVVPYNPRIHDEIGTPGVREGQPVRVISPGYEGVADGRKFTAVKARVQHEPAAKAQATAAAERLRRTPAKVTTAEVSPPRNSDAALARERAAAAEAVPAKAAPAKVTAKAAKPARRGVLAGFKPDELNEVPAGAPTTGPKGEKLSAKELEIMDYFGTGSAGHYFTKPTTSADQSAFHRLQQMGLLERKEGERGPSYRPNDEGWKLIHARGGGHGPESMKGKAAAATPAKAVPAGAANASVKRAPHTFRISPDAAKTLGRENGDQTLKVPNGGADQGRIHLDSQIGGLWQDLAHDPRAQNSTLNKITDIGNDLGTGKIDVATARERLRALDPGNSALKDRVDQAIKAMEVPKMSLDLPSNTPTRVRDVLEKLNGVPAYHVKQDGKTPIERLVDAVRTISKGDRNDPNYDEARRDIEHAAGRVHESGDGVYQAQRDASELSAIKQGPDVRKWLRGGVTQAEIKSPVPKVGNAAPSAPKSVTTKGLAEGEGIPISNRLALENKLSNRNTLNAMDRAVRHEGTRAKVPELFQTLMTQLSQAGVGPNDEPRKSLIEWYNRHFS